jgi:hypothetical protein
VWVASGISRDAMGSLLFDRVERILLNTAEQDITFNLADRFTYELG